MINVSFYPSAAGLEVLESFCAYESALTALLVNHIVVNSVYL
jgi:hypothetical protein